MAFSLQSISSSPILAPPRIVLYGSHKIGKTTTAACAPVPIFILTEEGLGRLQIPHFPLITSYQQVLDAISVLFREQHPFQTLVIDSLDWLEPLIWQETARKHKKPDIEAFGYGKGYQYALDSWRMIIDGLNALRDKGMTIILLAHSMVKRYDDPNAEPYDRYQIKLQERAAALIEEWADVLLFANLKVYTAKTDVGFGNKKTRGVGEERVMYTEERPAFKAGNRYSLPPELPLSWAALSDALASSLTQHP